MRTLKIKGLFLKTFIWFWLTTVITISATYWISSKLIDNNQYSHDLDELVEHYFEHAQENLQEDGIDEFKDWLKHRRLPRGIGVLLIDQDNTVIAKKRIPKPILEKYLSTGQWPKPHGRALNIKQKTVKIDARPLTLFVLWFPKKVDLDKHNSAPWFDRFNQRTPIWATLRLLLALLISGMICYLVARNISKPIIKLRSAVNDLAQGNFDSNVAQSFSKRDDEIAELAKDFDQMADQLKSQFKQREDLLRDISHELRSPLARMRVASELLKSKTQDDSQIRRIETEITRLDELIGEIINFSKLKNADQKINRSEFDLTKLISTIISDANFEGKTVNKHIEFLINNNQMVNINADRNLIFRAIENVIRNSVKYTAPDTGVNVSLETSNNVAIITVHDKGPGVPEDQLDKIFEPFFRVSESRSRASGGTGLGLAISKRAIEIHRGQISAHNHQQGGLVTTIRLPLSAQL